MLHEIVNYQDGCITEVPQLKLWQCPLFRINSIQSGSSHLATFAIKSRVITEYQMSIEIYHDFLCCVCSCHVAYNVSTLPFEIARRRPECLGMDVAYGERNTVLGEVWGDDRHGDGISCG